MNKTEKLRASLAARGIDAILITSEINHRYFSGFHNPDGYLLVTQKNAYVMADFRYIEAAEAEANPAFTVMQPTAAVGATIAPLLEKDGAKKLAYEDLKLTCFAFARLQSALPDIEFVPAGELMDDIREFKTDEEIACVIEAQRIAEKSFDELLGRINYSMTETELAAELEFLMKRNGAEDKSFDTICVSGAASALPHGVPRNTPLERGFLTFDFGAVYRGYHSDMTRTVCVGSADAAMKRLYDTVLRAQTAVLDVISEGKSNREMDKIARDIIEGEGYAGCFGHGLGHGVGMYIHENPSLSPRADEAAVLRAGQIVTVEPGIYIKGKYGCRIEDMVAIVPGGAKNLTLTKKDLIEL